MMQAPPRQMPVSTKSPRISSRKESSQHSRSDLKANAADHREQHAVASPGRDPRLSVSNTGGDQGSVALVLIDRVDQDFLGSSEGSRSKSAGESFMCAPKSRDCLSLNYLGPGWVLGMVNCRPTVSVTCEEVSLERVGPLAGCAWG